MSEVVARADQAVIDSDMNRERLRALEKLKIALPAFIRVNECRRCPKSTSCRGHWVHVYGEVGP